VGDDYATVEAALTGCNEWEAASKKENADPSSLALSGDN
jgi:hypothetical protein